jgi:hypothetical protein
MWRFVIAMLLAYLLVPMAYTAGQGLALEPPEIESPEGFSVLESNKEVAYSLERSIEAVKERVEAKFKKGEISQENMEQFKQLHWEAKSFLHLYIMANLYYEEAPVDTYAHLVEVFARDMLNRVMILDRFCIEIGIEAIPSEEV